MTTTRGLMLGYIGKSGAGTERFLQGEPDGPERTRRIHARDQPVVERRQPGQHFLTSQHAAGRDHLQQDLERQGFKGRHGNRRSTTG